MCVDVADEHHDVVDDQRDDEQWNVANKRHAFFLGTSCFLAQSTRYKKKDSWLRFGSYFKGLRMVNNLTNVRLI